MSPVIFSIGKFDLRWYSVMILIAAITAFTIIYREAKKFRIPSDSIFDFMFYGLIFGIIGARIYYVLFNWSMYKSNVIEVIQIWNGGLAIHGGLIAGVIAIYIFAKKSNIRFLRITDIACVPLILAQAIGRWGNFFNQEAHGAATTYEWLYNFPSSAIRNISIFGNHPFSGLGDPIIHMPSFIIKGMNIDGVYYIPTFFFESCACVLAFIILMFVRRSKKIHLGTLTGLYMIFYGTIRFFIEITRTDALMIGAFKMAQIASIVLVISGIALLIYNATKPKFTDLYNEKDENE